MNRGLLNGIDGIAPPGPVPSALGGLWTLRVAFGLTRRVEHAFLRDLMNMSLEGRVRLLMGRPVCGDV
jgi:hypothetical protein